MKKVYISLCVIVLIVLTVVLFPSKKNTVYMDDFREFSFEETNNGDTMALHVDNTGLAEYIFNKKEYSETERVIETIRMRASFKLRKTDLNGILAKMQLMGFVNLGECYVKDKELQGGRAGRFLLSSTKIEKTIRFNNYMPNGLKELRSYIIEYILFKYSGDIYKNAIRIK